MTVRYAETAMPSESKPGPRLALVAGTLISPVYRILRYLETKNTTTLIVGILCLVTGCGNAILAIIDIITEVTKGRITVLAD